MSQVAQIPVAAPVAAPSDTASTAANIAAMRADFERLRASHRANAFPSYEERLANLDALIEMTVSNRDAICRAISADFGNRSSHETLMADVFTTVAAARYIKKNLRRWMRPRSRHVAMVLKPGRAKVHLQPLGVVGIIAPWNYPYQLATIPLANALAAGNRAMLKPSEYTPQTSALMAELCRKHFAADTVSVVTGGPEVGAAFSDLPFDHLFFTGSTAVGRHVMQAAAKHLTPVTLELGGKSPTVLHGSYPIGKAAARITAGKWFNAGQTCIAPDYLMAPKAKLPELVEALKAEVAKAYPTLADNGDYTAVVNARHHSRIQGLVDDAVAKGATRVEINPAGENLDPGARKMPPTLLLDVHDDMSVMQEEIFGPVLPIMGYESIDEAIDYINDHDRPLAMYYFDDDSKRAEDILKRTLSGGVSVNDTLLHCAVEDLPFGGVGPSGIGAYHGVEGFETFSHKRGVFYQAKWNAAAMTAPPYGERIDKLLGFLLK